MANLITYKNIIYNSFSDNNNQCDSDRDNNDKNKDNIKKNYTKKT